MRPDNTSALYCSRSRTRQRLTTLIAVLALLAGARADAERRSPRTGEEQEPGSRAARTRSAATPVEPTLEQPEPLHEDEPPPPGEEPAAERGIACLGGKAATFPCHDVDLLALMPRSQLGAAEDEIVNDLWGWVDPRTGREYALVGRAAGVSFVDVTDPFDPRLVGLLPTRATASAWRDIKTIGNFALVVADASPGHGMQIFDLFQLDGSAPGTVFSASADYFGAGLGFSTGEILGSSHNMAVNEESGFAYIVGTNTCAGGLHMVDLRQPLLPRYAGCFAEDGYTHDAQCIIYRGPDGERIGREICVAANEDTLTIVDVTDKSDPDMLSRTSYPGVGYTHQVWMTEDHQHLLLDDELDELSNEHGTRTHVFDVSDLGSPQLIGTYEAPRKSTDHNQYVHEGFSYQANYTSGLRVLSLDEVSQGELSEVAYFDTYPAHDEPGFEGAWSVYPFLPSGHILVSSIAEGLFVLEARIHDHGHH